MTKEELIGLQALPLEIKKNKSKLRIKEWIENFGMEKIYISFSGGVGSTALLYLVNEVVREMNLELGKNPKEDFIPALFVNTRNEFPEIVNHVYQMKACNNEKYKKCVRNLSYNDKRLVADQIVIKTPEKKFNEILKETGYLIASKKTSRCISDAQKLKSKYPDTYKTNERYLSLTNTKNQFSVPLMYQKFIDSSIKVSANCCHLLKHTVYAKYEKETGRCYPFTGEQAEESFLRTKSYLSSGCNRYDATHPKSTPLGFWTSSDLLQYILEENIPYAECYGDIVYKNSKVCTTGEKRTGCIICTAGLGRESGMKENRYQRMARKYPKHHKIMLQSLEEGGYGMKPVLDLMNVNYYPEKVFELDELIEMYM